MVLFQSRIDSNGYIACYGYNLVHTFLKRNLDTQLFWAVCLLGAVL